MSFKKTKQMLIEQLEELTNTASRLSRDLDDLYCDLDYLTRDVKSLSFEDPLYEALVQFASKHVDPYPEATWAERLNAETQKL